MTELTTAQLLRELADHIASQLEYDWQGQVTNAAPEVALLEARARAAADEIEGQAVDNPASQVTLIRWITDRKPTEADTVGNCVLVQDLNGDPTAMSLSGASCFQEWAHCKGWKAPSPSTTALNTETALPRRTLNEH